MEYFSHEFCSTTGIPISDSFVLVFGIRKPHDMDFCGKTSVHYLISGIPLKLPSTLP